MKSYASIQSWDERRNLIVPGNHDATIQFAVEHWIHTALRSIQQRGRFAVALSGGSTPKEIYQHVTQSKEIPWDKVWLFWSDERAVPPDHPESNYRMAMESGFQNVPIPKAQILRMKGEATLPKSAREYEEKIRHHLDKSFFDLVMLGMGEDGHTASLFPKTDALDIQDRLVAEVFVPQKNNWRLTVTFPCIAHSRATTVYALGKNKQKTIRDVLNAPILSAWPASRLGNTNNKVLWILDTEAAKDLTPPPPIS